MRQVLLAGIFYSWSLESCPKAGGPSWQTLVVRR